MPWEIKQNGDRYCVYKEGESDPLHCYDTEGEAKDYMAALYASEKGIIVTAVKAAGEWELEVLGVPFGGPNGGKDADGEYFSDSTSLYLEQFPHPLVTYYHGYTEKGTPQGEPVLIGKAEYIGVKPDGHWWRIVLDKTSEYAKRVWESARRGLARASSGSVAHLVRRAKDGLITHWPVAELALIDAEGNRQPANNFAVALPVMKSHYNRAGIEYPEAAQSADNEQPPENNNMEEKGMETQEINKLVEEKVAAALKASEEAKTEEAARQAEIDKQIKERVEAEVKAEKEKMIASRRLDSAPYVKKYNEVDKYDNIDTKDLALLGTLMQSKGSQTNVNEMALKALALRFVDGKDEQSGHAREALKAKGMGMKSDEVMQQDLTSYGDEWVGVAYGTQLWEAIRVGTFVVNNIPNQIEVPQGMESYIVPLESTDPTFYKVAETTDHNATTGFPNATVTSSQAGTGKATISLAKMGARVAWSGELDEDSLIPMLPHLRRKLETVGAEIVEHVIIDGDSTTTATTNINSIAATGVQTTQVYLLTNGFRKSCLVTTTANSRSAAGSFVSSDFISTVKLMGSAGVNALDRNKVGFIIGPNEHWAALDLPEVKTRDVFAQPTIEQGVLQSIYGYKVYVSANICRASTVRLSNTAGKVDQNTVGNNLYGSILAVRWDQWYLGWKRRMTMEVTRYPRSDSYEITALMRWGLVQRDTEASAITYYLGV